jgi:hypothetical protein
MSNTHNNSVKEDWKEYADAYAQGYATKNSKSYGERITIYYSFHAAIQYLESNVISPLLEENEVLKRRVRDLEAGASGSDLATKATLHSKSVKELSNEWVSVEDKLPEISGEDQDSDYVLGIEKNNGWDADHSDMVVCWYNKGEGWIIAHYRAGSRPIKITHWMPLPDMPNSNYIPERSDATEGVSSNDAEAHHHLQLIHQEVIKEKEELKQELDNLKNNQ